MNLMQRTHDQASDIRETWESLLSTVRITHFYRSQRILSDLVDNSRPDVGVVQRLDSPIIGLKAFNNWVKSVLISLCAHPALEKSAVVRSNGGQGLKRGKVLDMGCGKGGDISKWSKSRAAEVFFAGR